MGRNNKSEQNKSPANSHKKKTEKVQAAGTEKEKRPERGGEKVLCHGPSQEWGGTCCGGRREIRRVKDKETCCGKAEKSLWP